MKKTIIQVMGLKKKKNLISTVVFETHYVIVINKNAGIITHSEDSINEFRLRWI